MFGRGHGQGEHIANGLMEARVGSIAEGHRLVFVLQEVLDVAHLMVHCDQVIHSHDCALFDPGDTNEAVSKEPASTPSTRLLCTRLKKLFQCCMHVLVCDWLCLFCVLAPYFCTAVLRFKGPKL